MGFMKHSFALYKFLLKMAGAVMILIFLFACKKETTTNNTVTMPPPIVTPPPPAASPYSLTARPTTLTAHCKGFYEYLPEGYLTDAEATRYPLLIFFHGGSETGADSTTLGKLLVHGPLRLVKNGAFPTSFTVNNQTYKFIIIAPQFTSSGTSYPDEINTIIEYAKQKYKVDASRIYLTGLSFGAGLMWNYIGQNTSYAKKIAAMVSIAAYINETRGDFKVDSARAQTISSSNLPIWSTHNSGDNTCPLVWITNAYTLLRNSNPAPDPSPRLTVFNVNGHGGWTQTYDPSFRENNLNIYEWMLQYHR
jgi:predicted peptidase